MTEDIIKEVKRHSYYLKPGERRRVKQFGAEACPKKASQRAGLSYRNQGRCCQAAAFVS
jgi:hypothetical protein